MIFDFFFRCRHKNVTFPQARKDRPGHYVVCLDCAQEFEYDWAEMRTKQRLERATRPINQKALTPVIEMAPERKVTFR